jgi:MraZ protein
VVFQSVADPAIEGITLERMQEMSAALETFPPFSDEREAYELMIFGTAQPLQIDLEGRCNLPRALLDAAGIGNEVAFVGRGKTFQIWDPGILEERRLKGKESLRAAGTAFPKLAQVA